MRAVGARETAQDSLRASVDALVIPGVVNGATPKNEGPLAAAKGRTGCRTQSAIHAAKYVIPRRWPLVLIIFSAMSFFIGSRMVPTLVLRA
jgi:hypothetical protein